MAEFYLGREGNSGIGLRHGSELNLCKYKLLLCSSSLQRGEVHTSHSMTEDLITFNLLMTCCKILCSSNDMMSWMRIVDEQGGSDLSDRKRASISSLYIW